MVVVRVLGGWVRGEVLGRVCFFGEGMGFVWVCVVSLGSHILVPWKGKFR